MELVFFDKTLEFSVFKSIISCKGKSIFKKWPTKSSIDSGCWALLNVGILFFFLQLLLSNVGWQFPLIPFRKELRLCRLRKSAPKVPGGWNRLCGWGDAEGTDYKGSAGVIGENCFVCLCERACRANVKTRGGNASGWNWSEVWGIVENFNRFWRGNSLSFTSWQSFSD